MDLSMTWPPTSRASAALLFFFVLLLVVPGPAWAQETVGVPWTGEPGITETVAEIMARERLAPKVTAGRPRSTKNEIDLRKLLPRRQATGGMAVPRWPMLDRALAAPRPFNPQAVGTSFLGAQLFPDSGFIPPDSMGDVGPTQILVAVNGRIKVFDKSGVLGGLNANMDTFFSSVRNGAGTSDPHVRYDRLSGRWFITIINVPLSGGNPFGPNRVLIAVSSGSTITDTSSFTFFQFQQDLPGGPSSDTNGFADYPKLGVDKFALYIGANVFNQTGTDFIGTTGFVVNKSNLLAGTLTVTAFRQMAPDDDDPSACAPTTGPLTPQGVNNDDPGATEGYFIGVDFCVFNLLQIRRVNNPGGTPTLSVNLAIGVPTTRFPIPQVQPGGPPSLDALDDRLFAAAVHKNKISGASTLWTAHNIEVNSSGVGTVGGGRNGSRWYEIGSLTTTPTLVQAGTLFDSAGTNPFGYWIPSVAMSGQGHMALGASRASATGGTGPASGHASVSVAGRLRTDPLGMTQTPTLAVDSDFRYDVFTTPQTDPERWGDYSQVGVDPNDDMSMWTFQEYTNATNSWGVRAIKLIAPPPATPNCGTPATVPANSTQNVTITGTSVSGSGFFDPGPDSGGPGYANRLTAAVSGGVLVNSVTFNSPTSVTLNVTTNATGGPRDVTITNPDGQSVVGIGCIVVPQTDLSITKSDGQTTVVAGTPVTYTIVASNGGPTGVTGATVTDTFPATISGVTWTCSASGGSSCGAPSGSGNINQTVNLLAGGNATFVATGTLSSTATGSLSNTASIAAPGGVADPNLGNNSATDTDTILMQSDVSITKTDGASTAGAGSPVTYTITASNAGPSAVTAATVSDTFPAALTGVTWTCSASGGSSCGTASGTGNINHTVNLLVGGTATFTATGTLDVNASGTLSNTATVAVPGGVTDPVPGNNSATDNDTIIPAAQLSITKTDGQTTAAPGQVITYTIVVSNAGPAAVVGATVSDTVPASLLTPTWTCIGANGGTCTAGPVAGNINDTVNLPVGATVTYTLTGMVSPNPTTLSNTATITPPPTVNDPNLADNSATDTDTLTCFSETVVVPDGRLTQTTVATGATVWFAATLRIGNAYSVEFKNLTGTAPPGTLTVFSGNDACGGTSSVTANDTSMIDPPGTGGIARASFTAGGTDTFFRARLVNTTGAPVTISFGWSDLTLFSPAWSTNGNFDTFYSFLNTTGSTLSGTLTLLDTTGAVLSTFPVTVPAGQTASTNTSAMGVTRNRAGTARFVHNGPPGAILAETAIANFSISPAYVQPVKFQPVREAR
jgi:uncharacterized repeat protein (TIGR01451 family)